MRRHRKGVILLLIAGSLSACTVHPAGEKADRAAMLQTGRVYEHRFEKRQLPLLAPNATPEELVAYALLANGDLEKSYWDWRAAMEQVPQEGTQKTGLMLSFTSMISNGTTAADQTVLGLGNDPMNNIVLPSKLGTAAAVALDNARAVGLRFDKARFELRNQVLSAYEDYALTAEYLRLEESSLKLLELTSRITASRVATAGAMQLDLLKIENELQTARNELAADRAKLPGQLATLNALLNRTADAPLEAPPALLAVRPLVSEDKELLALAARNNPELLALARESAANQLGIKKAKLEYLPDFGLNVSTDLAGEAQSIMGSAVLPYLRYQAIDAEIRQAEANLRSNEAMLRQASYDLSTRVVTDLATLRDAQRQIDLFEKNILPRAERLVSATQRTYAAGQSSMLDVLDAQRSLIDLRRMVADLKITYEKRLADLEAAAATNLSRPS